MTNTDIKNIDMVCRQAMARYKWALNVTTYEDILQEARWAYLKSYEYMRNSERKSGGTMSEAQQFGYLKRGVVLHLMRVTGKQWSPVSGGKPHKMELMGTRGVEMTEEHHPITDAEQERILELKQRRVVIQNNMERVLLRFSDVGKNIIKDYVEQNIHDTKTLSETHGVTAKYARNVVCEFRSVMREAVA